VLSAKIKLDFDADNGLTNVSGKYSQWTDQVSAIALTQGTAGNRPTPRTIGAKNFVQFTASASCSLSSTTPLLATVLGVPGDIEIYTVYQADTLDAGTNFGAPGMFRTNTSNRLSHSIGSGGVYGNGNFVTGFARSAASTAPSTGVTYRARMRYDTAGSTIYSKNGSGAEASNVNATGGQVSTNYDFGGYMGGVLGAPFFDGAIRRVLVFTTQLTAGERADLDAFFVYDCGATT
jgi:hypothetical protein